MKKRQNKIQLGRCLVIAGVLVVAGCDSGGGTSSGTSGGPGYMSVPLAGWWHGSWSRNTTLTNILVDTSDVTTHLGPQDGVARLQISSATGSSQTISGSLMMSGFLYLVIQNMAVKECQRLLVHFLMKCYLRPVFLLNFIASLVLEHTTVYFIMETIQ